MKIAPNSSQGKQSQGHIECRKDPSGTKKLRRTWLLLPVQHWETWTSTRDGRTQTGDARRRDGTTPNGGGDQKWTSPLMMVPQISRLEVPYLAEVMPVGVLNFPFPVAVFLCCCDRDFILLCLQDSKSEFLSSSYYKGLQREYQEGRQESCLSVTAEHSTHKVLPIQSSKYCKSAGVMSSMTPAEAGDVQEPHMCTSTSTKGNCSNKHHVVQRSRNGWKFSKWDKWQSIFSEVLHT